MLDVQAPRRFVRRTKVRLRGAPVFRNYPYTYARATLLSRRYASDFSGVRSYLMFVGYPRSGHSLVGALLDAHPNVLVAHELDALPYVDAGFRQRQLFALLVERARERVGERGVESSGYSYRVPGQWQGRWQRLDVIGDKKGGRSTTRLREDPGLLDRLAAAVRVPVKVVHVVRNPYDNIATMHRWMDRPLDWVTDLYGDLAETVAEVRHHLGPGQFHEMHLDDLVTDPAGQLKELCGFVEVQADPTYLDACAGILFDSPRRTGDTVEWTQPALDRVRRMIADRPWLARYGPAR